MGLQKIIYKTINICAVAAIVMLAACNKRPDVSLLPKHTVVVLHSWDSLTDHSEEFEQMMAEEFALHRVNAEVHHIYCNMRHRYPAIFAKEDWPGIRKQVEQLKPEIILLNDDPIMEVILGGYIGRDRLILKTPTVFAGVTALNRSAQAQYPLMVGFEERINLQENLSIIRALKKKDVVAIELDYEPIDQRLRNRFSNFLEDTVRYVNNGDFHLESLNEDSLQLKFPGKTVVNFFSAARPYTNHRDGESDSIGKRLIRSAYTKAKETPQLQVKYDIFSNSIISRTRQPQFTCIREQFNRIGTPLFLCGYFTSLETQIKDQVKYAAEILVKGSQHFVKTVAQMQNATHDSDHYMDWRAMQIYAPALSYSEYSKNGGGNYNIVNAPYEVENRFALIGYAFMLLLLATLLIYITLRLMNGWKKKDQHDLLEEHAYEEKVFNLLLLNESNSLFHIFSDKVELSEKFARQFNLSDKEIPLSVIENSIHEDSLPSFNIIRNFRNQRGKKALRLKMTPDKGQTWHWVEVTYTATDETARQGEIFGMLLSIDKIKHMEDQMQEAQQLASQVDLKENFLANISHDLRTPLNAVTGFSGLLSMPEMQLTEEERVEYRNIIHENTNMILNMIDGVMQKAQLDTGDLEILPKPVHISKLVMDSYNTNRIIVPTHLKLNLELDQPDCEVNIDLTRTKQVVNNFLSNAFKFTAEGSVTLGWKHLPDTDEVEVYVRDTGIGVKEDMQEKLFDRYVKVNETDCGTGLGLCISKTIIEKQGGTIGVESKYGEGSKFFFRLKKLAQCLILILTVCLGLFSTSSCTKFRAPRQRANVLMVHSYDRSHYAYRQFNEDLRQALLKNEIDPTIRHIYLDLDNPYDVEDKRKHYFEVCDSLKGAGWKPDIILTEGDRASRFMLDVDSSHIDDYAKALPIIFGALHHPDWKRIQQHTNMVVINDPIDYETNVKLARDISGSNVVVIELDYFEQDSIIRNELRQAIDHVPFVDNSDFHLKDISHERLTTEYRDSTVVLCYSVDHPERNSDTIMTLEEGYARLGRVFAHSWRYPTLTLKKDLFSMEIADKTGRPQFTAVKTNFGDGRARYLCGYFASYKTIAQDLASTAAQILTGKAKPETLIALKHKKKQYMDYRAMQVWGLEYSKYKDNFEIVGAPLSATTPLVYYGTYVLVIAMILSAIFAVMLIVFAWRNKNTNQLVEEVKRKAEMRELAMHGADSRTVRSAERVKEILSRLHPDYADNYMLMEQATEAEGTHTYDIYVDIDDKDEYKWWQLRFYRENKRVDGILIDIDATKKREDDLQTAILLAEEAKRKEDFLTTISHEIRTPLNAVVGFSDILATMPREMLSDEEMKLYDKAIKASNATLTDMIEDILMFTRIDSDRIRYIISDFDVKTFIDELVAEWKPRLPDGQDIMGFCYGPPLTMHSDRERVKYIINQMISNASKFMKDGTIMIGMALHMTDEKVELFVVDNGCGIPREKQRIVFNLFWKDDGFVPGLGLGLHVCKKLADGLGLKLMVDSKVDYGSKFSIIGDMGGGKNGQSNGKRVKEIDRDS